MELRPTIEALVGMMSGSGDAQAGDYPTAKQPFGPPNMNYSTKGGKFYETVDGKTLMEAKRQVIEASLAKAQLAMAKNEATAGKIPEARAMADFANKDLAAQVAHLQKVLAAADAPPGPYIPPVAPGVR